MSTTCTPPIQPVIGPYGVASLNAYPAGNTQLITSPDTKPNFTANRTSDARTALTRGLAEYLMTLELPANGGRNFYFRKVYEVWAEPEDPADYPSAAVLILEESQYDASRLVPSGGSSVRLPAPDNRYLLVSSELTAKLVVEIVATDPVERQALVSMVEDGFAPVDWMYGVRLALPHYFGQHATYEPLSVQYFDSDEEGMRRFRRAQITVAATVPVTRLSAYPDAQPRFRLEVMP